MKRLAVVLAGVLASGALMTAGCCDEYKEQIEALQSQNAKLTTQNTQLRTEKTTLLTGLAQANERSEELSAELETKQTELDDAKAKLDQERRRRTGPSGPSGPTETGLRDWQTTATGAKITLSSDILFRSGQASLSSQGAARLKQVAASIRSDYPNARVRVYGFSDSDPIHRSAKLWKDNLDLSANRAMAVTRELRKTGIAAERIETIAMGATNFAAPNTTPAGKARNRRVEIVVIKP